MTEVGDSSSPYYYHYDALGSVVALSDSTGATVQTYEYSVYGQVAVEDANHPNPYMFAGRRFDMEIGLYYNRARYYNPFTGRFLQTDPIGYEGGMNLYAYCGNSPSGLTDPSGCDPFDPCDLVESVVGAVSDVVEGAVNTVGRTAQAVANTVEYIQDDIDSHQEVLFYVIGQNGVRIPVKAFESRNRDSGIPFLAGFAMNIGGEIHIGYDVAADLMFYQNIRDAQGIDLEMDGTPITDAQNWPNYSTNPEEFMAHEIGHQIDADSLGLFYLVVGAVATHNREGDFERNASCLGVCRGTC